MEQGSTSQAGRSWVRDVLLSAMIVVAYVGAAKLGFLVAFAQGKASLLWPPSGVAVLALMLFGFRFWWACWLGNVIATVSSGVALPVAAFLATGNLSEYMLAAFLLSRFAPHLGRLSSLRDVGVLLGTGILAPIGAALCGAGTLVGFGIAPAQAFSFIGLTWWAGDTGGILILLPAVLAWRSSRAEGAIVFESHLKELTIFLVSSFVITSLVFRDPLMLGEQSLIFVYALSLLLLWGALRLAALGAALGVVAVVVPAVMLTAAGYGPFVRADLHNSMLLLMGFLLVSSITALALAAVLGERDRVAAQARVLSRAIEQSATAVVITDAQGDITYTNTAFTALTGYEASEVLGENPRFLKSGHMSQGDYKALWDTLLAGDTWRGEFLNISKNKSLVWENATISPLRDEHQRITHFVATAEDVTKRKADERRLIAALGRTEKAKAELERITFAITHTLQEPLRSISGFAQLLRRRYSTELDDTASSYLQRIVDGADRMYHLFHDLMHYVMVDENQPDSQINLQAVVERVIAGLGDEGRYVRVVGQLPTITAIEQQIARVFEHAIGNGLKYRSPDRDPEIVISANPVETVESRLRKENNLPQSETESWEIIIQDNGIGIDNSFKPKLFTLFSRLHTIDDYDGTGVGLAYCRRVIEHHGGSVWINSSPDVGTALHFILSVQPSRQESHE